MATLAGIIAEYLEKNDRDVPLAELVEAVHAGGLKDRAEAQVYAGVQSMASTGKCGRGQSARTYCRLKNAAPRPDKPEREKVANPNRRAKQVGPSIPNDTVLAGLEAALGPASERPAKEKLFAWLLLGDCSHEYLLERTMIVLKKPATFWCKWFVGPNVYVGFK